MEIYLIWEYFWKIIENIISFIRRAVIHNYDLEFVLRIILLQQIIQQERQMLILIPCCNNHGDKMIFLFDEIVLLTLKVPTIRNKRNKQ